MLNLVLLAWRLVAVGQAFLDTRRTGPTGRLGIDRHRHHRPDRHRPAPRHLPLRDGSRRHLRPDLHQRGPGRDDDREGASPLTPRPAERINVLLVGIDKRSSADGDPDRHDDGRLARPDRAHGLAGVAAARPDRHAARRRRHVRTEAQLAAGLCRPESRRVPRTAGCATLQDAVGALLGITIHYHAELDFAGFIKMVDAVGGVDIVAPRDFEDPKYDGYGTRRRQAASRSRPGRITSTGPTALAYARSRKALGESDFTRQARQQQILVALRAKVTKGGSLLFQLPGLLDAVGETIRTDVPIDRLPTSRRSSTRSARTTSRRRHPVTAGQGQGHPVRRLAGPEPDEDPGDGGRRCSASRDGARPVADAEADPDAEAGRVGRGTDREAVGRAAGPRTRAPPASGPSAGRPRPDARSRASRPASRGRASGRRAAPRPVRRSGRSRTRRSRAARVAMRPRHVPRAREDGAAARTDRSGRASARTQT